MTLKGSLWLKERVTDGSEEMAGAGESGLAS